MWGESACLGRFCLGKTWYLSGPLVTYLSFLGTNLVHCSQVIDTDLVYGSVHLQDIFGDTVAIHRYGRK